MDFAEMMALEEHGPDTYIGVGPRYPWGGLYGGQILAQGLLAASGTVEEAYRIHSLHAYFIRTGDADEPIRFEVDRIRNGRSLSTRRVVARQSVGAILNMAASYQVDEAAPEVQTAQMPEVPGPDEAISNSWSPLFERRSLRIVDPPGRSTGWLRMSDPVGEDPVLQACALAFLSDDLPTEAVVAQHPDRPEPGGQDYPFWSASLDHAVWFHRPLAADEWHLHDFTCHGLMSSRGLAVGEVFTGAGRHVATVTQEVLLRRRREG